MKTIRIIADALTDRLIDDRRKAESLAINIRREIVSQIIIILDIAVQPSKCLYEDGDECLTSLVSVCLDNPQVTNNVLDLVHCMATNHAEWCFADRCKDIKPPYDFFPDLISKVLAEYGISAPHY